MARNAPKARPGLIYGDTSYTSYVITNRGSGHLSGRLDDVADPKNPTKIPTIMTTHSPVRSSSSSAPSSSLTEKHSTAGHPCWSRAVFIDSASRVSMQRCGSCPPTKKSTSILDKCIALRNNSWRTKPSTESSQRCARYFGMISLSIPVIVNRSRQRFSEEVKCKHSAPAVSLSSRQHLVMSIPVPKPVKKIADGVATKIVRRRPPRSQNPHR